MAAGLLVVELEADSEDRVGDFVLLLPDIKQCLTKVATKVEVGPDIMGLREVVPAVI